MFTINIAELNICIDNKYSYVENMCSEYITSASPDFILSASSEEINDEAVGENSDMGYCESLAIYRKIAEIIIKEQGFLIHGAAIEVMGTGVIFLAKSGVGKSTHALLWQKLLGNKMQFINGDKPLVRIYGEKVIVYGTPWAGKEKMHTNKCVELKKVCFIERSDVNECFSVSKGEFLEKLMEQIYIPRNTDNFLMLLDLLSKFTDTTEFYLIKCNTDISAAYVAVKGTGLM